MLLKGMGESFLLSKDEPLTPNIDKVMRVWIFRRKTQNTKIGKNWTSQFWVLFFRKQEEENSFKKILIRSLQAGVSFKYSRYKTM